MITRWILTAAILLSAATASAQTKRNALENNLVDNRYLFGSGRFTRGQRVLSAGNPSLVGLGIKRTLLRCDDAAVTDRFVTVENFGSGTHWDARFAEVASLTLDGMEDISGVSYADEREIGLSPWGKTHDSDGIHLDGQFASIEKVLVKRFRGTGIKTRHGSATTARSWSIQNYVGIYLAASDSSVSHSWAVGCRDAGGWVAGGNCQSMQTHYFGARVALFNNGGGFRSANDTYADCQIGYMGTGNASYAQITNANMQHCFSRCMVSQAGPASFTNCIFSVQHRVDQSGFTSDGEGSNKNNTGLEDFTGCVGVDFQSPRITILGGVIRLENYHHGTTTGATAAEAVWFRDGLVGLGGDNCTIRDTALADEDGFNGSIGIRVKGDRHGIQVDVNVGVEWPTDHWQDSNDRILVVEPTARMRDCTFVFRGTQSDLVTNPGKYVDLPAGWKPPRSNNRVTLIRSDTGEVLQLENRAY